MLYIYMHICVYVYMYLCAYHAQRKAFGKSLGPSKFTESRALEVAATAPSGPSRQRTASLVQDGECSGVQRNVGA